MTNSLQEQLIKAGLVSEKQSKPRKPKTGSKRTSKNKSAPAKQTPEAKKADLEGVVENKINAKLRRKQIREKLRNEQLNDPEAEIAYHFTRDNLVKRIYVTEKQHQALLQRELIIIHFGEKHYLVPHTLEPSLKEIKPDIVVIRHPESGGDQDDEEFPVPDDLMW